MIILRNTEILGASGVRDIVVEGPTILGFGSNSPSTGDQEIRFNNAIAFPGLINSHDHLEFNAYDQLDGGPYRDYLEWTDKLRLRHAATIAAVESIPRALRIRIGIAKNLFCGVTSVAHHGPDPEYDGAPIDIIGGTRAVHSPRLEGVRGMLAPDRRPIVAHVGEGIDDGAQREIDTLLRRNIWKKKLIGVHAIAMQPDQAERFAAIVWCPASNEFLYGRTAPIAQLKRHTVILFGTDSTLSASWNIWDHLRRARELAQLTDDELIAALTTDAAKVWNLSNHGCVKAGAAADIVVARKRREDQRNAFFAINPEDILLVIKDGKVILVDASVRAQLQREASLFPVTVNGVEKFTSEDYRVLWALAGSANKNWTGSFPSVAM